MAEPLRIGLVTTAAPVHGVGGVQDHTADLARGLAAAGHEVVVVAPRHPAGTAGVERDGVRWLHVDAPAHDFTSRAWQRASVAAVRAERGRRPLDVVHGQGSAALGLLRAGVDRDVPVVSLFHGNWLGLVRASLRRQARARSARSVAREWRMLAWITRRHLAPGNPWVFRRGEAIVPSAQQLRDTRLCHALDRERVHVVPNGVDTARFVPRCAPGLRAALGLGGGPVFVTVGRLNREKGFGHAIRALARLGDPAATLLVVGDGEERRALERAAAELGVAGRVRFAGAVSADGVADHLAAADVFLFPTERDEAAPLVLPQAMASGLPVVASAVGGIPEVVDGAARCGLLVPPGDPAALAAAMGALARDPALRAELGRAARARVVDGYSLERMVAGTVDVYRLAIARHRAAGRVPASLVAAEA